MRTRVQLKQFQTHTIQSLIFNFRQYNSNKERKGMMIPNGRNPCRRKLGDAGISSFSSPRMLGSISDHTGTSSHDSNCKPQKPPRDGRNLAADHHRSEQIRRATNWARLNWQSRGERMEVIEANMKTVHSLSFNSNPIVFSFF